MTIHTDSLSILPGKQHPNYYRGSDLMDAAFLLTVGSFLLTVELLCLQLTIFAFLLAVGAFFSLTILACLLTLGVFFADSGKVRLIRALRDCKQRSSTVSKKAPIVP